MVVLCLIPRPFCFLYLCLWVYRISYLVGKFAVPLMNETYLGMQSSS